MSTAFICHVLEHHRQVRCPFLTTQALIPPAEMAIEDDDRSGATDDKIVIVEAETSSAESDDTDRKFDAARSGDLALESYVADDYGQASQAESSLAFLCHCSRSRRIFIVWRRIGLHVDIVIFVGELSVRPIIPD